ncbi:MAG: thioredoxin family protein [Aquabacterium sp.]
MRKALTHLAAAVLLAAAAPALAAVNLPSTGTAWLPAASDADVDAAFARAKAENKPVLLYWGAAWCPPCNQLKATLFKRQDFIDRTRHVVAVHVDGDRPGAQKLGSRFKVRGYPTVILVAADGNEITRLPGEADAAQIMNVLQAGLAGGRPVKAVLADAVAGKALGANEWRMLGWYGWDIDEAQLVPAADRAGLLAQLSTLAPASEGTTRTRFLLKALAESDEGKGIKPDAALRERVTRLLADPVAARAQMDVLVNWPDDIVKALAPEAGATRTALATGMDAALRRLGDDASLSRSDRLQALLGRVNLARLDAPKTERHPKLDPALAKAVRDHAAQADREITDGYERQAVITSAAYMLGQAGLWTDSDSLLKANLARSHSAYYLMSQLGSNARKLGRHDEALGWYEQAWVKSEGPATRLQWGSGYLTALIELAPKDAARIERGVSQFFAEAGQDKGAFYERSARSLQRVGTKLAEWNKGGQHDAVLARLHQQLASICGKLDAADAQKATCQGVLKPLNGKAA